MIRFPDLVEISKGFWIAFGVSALLAYPIWRMLLLTKSRQTISEYAPEGHQQKQGTPTMGGLIIAAGYLASLIFLKLGPLSAEAQADGSRFWEPYDRLVNGALILFVGFCAIGFVDDFVVPRMLKGKRGLGWKQKIVMQLLFAIAGIYAVVGHWDSVTVSIGVFLVLFYSNAFNFSDGIDGLAGTLLLGLVLGICGMSLMVDAAAPLPYVILPFAAAAIPFLFLNAPPAKVFMGDVGSLPIGAVLGLAVAKFWIGPDVPGLATRGTELRPGDPWVLFAVGVLSLVMVAELVPPPLQILSVKLRKKKLFPYTPIHHAFEKAGWPETRVTAMFALTQLIVSLAAIGILVYQQSTVIGAR